MQRAKTTIAAEFAWEQAKRPDDSPRATGALLEPHIRADEDLREQESLLRSEATRAEESGDPLLVCRAQHRLGLHLETAGAIEMAKHCLERAVDAISDDPAEQAAANNDLAVLFARQEQHSEARSKFAQATEAAERANLPVVAQVAHRNLGLMACLEGNPDTGLAFWDSAFRAAREGDDAAANAQILNNVAIHRLLTGSVEEAMQLFNRAILLAQRGGDIKTLAFTYNNLGLIFSGRSRGDHFAAIPFVEMSLALLTGPIDVLGRLYVLNNNILVYEQAHLEPARRFRAQFAETLKFFNSSYPVRSADPERAVYAASPTPSVNSQPPSDDWQISADPVLLRSFARCGARD